jgi:predicted DNA-binding protein
MERKREITMSLRLAPETHKALKILAAKEGKTSKECILEGLDKAFPGWRKEGEK